MVDLLQILKNNAIVEVDEIKKLEHLLEQYPWFSIGHQLILINLKKYEKPQYIEKLQGTAIYALSRTHLYNTIQKSINAKKYCEAKLLNNNEKQESKYSEDVKDDLLLNFSNEYFSLEDIPPIEVSDEDNNASELITKFIKENPRITPKVAPISDLENLIQIDEDLENEPISEMLAEIYASQGLYKQAVACYEKLSLLNPEKSVYFATQIDSLKSKEK